jgi:D-tyrosyl-tRNA(Tyr) deacylase
MKIVIQRVKEASVRVNDRITGQIGKGMLVLVGIEEADNQEDIEWMSGKLSRLRIFPDAEGVMNNSLVDIKANILVVSQFTLHASTKKGNRPSYIKAARPEHAIPLYESFLKQIEMDCQTIPQCGEFGASMEVSLINDGPVTILIDSKNRE